MILSIRLSVGEVQKRKEIIINVYVYPTEVLQTLIIKLS